MRDVEGDGGRGGRGKASCHQEPVAREDSREPVLSRDPGGEARVGGGANDAAFQQDCREDPWLTLRV
ncbi:hypothetical protein [Streptomyces virginiae]|uniref:hypothetical protein n=1 Tax=Streptomyces virginiae TaxID=1961 RepID=UPI0036F5ADF6